MDCSCRTRPSSLLISSEPSLRFPPSNLSLLVPKEAKLVKQQRMVVRSCSSGSAQNGDVDGFSLKPNKLFVQEAIGAEYGEGFETFRQDGPLKVDVDFWNEKLQDGFLQRIRYAMKPDEAYGLIFSWDNVVADTRSLKLDAWKQLAAEEGKEIAEENDIQRLMLYAGADHVLSKVLFWEKTQSKIDTLKLKLSEIYYDNLLRLTEPKEGLKDWLDAVTNARIPCAVVSNLDRKNMMNALERMGLQNYFQAVVSEEDGMESIAHRFLSAAVKLDRKPSKCVVFEDDPRGITAAHNCTMMAIGLIGSTFMEHEKQIIEKSPPKRKLTIDTIF
ncbi:hypothetical protein HID58_068543 [Brassica napus]|uniref:Haloacid dehalogenase-like hydrolase superfamily protein n=1 Tax=Brassica napus TaxID=3708 RepID=A0ABQ7ZLM2_BRANA|nr:hypothetical protein HID58_068543 [Brassica napus]